ncbi:MULTISPECIES: MarR family winged helix-turn-helix transcriptional regulator [Mycolicibacterium]|jgi:DNA-binding MarR family transcriptional regulator|uniref:Transcriptional regulator, MarR family n=1 Tax=Mycolicibacterium vanbaalenii (strain DSM 7251 / JCM 13017 / BCRC 16820 / KCTC 9966 / NRRL B-24157 / PYR-1) TaxID=350058 RepID=A1T5A6_MYCVP|nr:MULTISPECIES: MarR family transcriptional regulator [Mycolicibacterium]ABM12356.1 transcriptional regulator, MarR family [Mycolicibacterium vanbaalenii PYR-1]MCV7127735.1 MarR family transcriptional regulator [Mycolicibacterium vanbaalenii PYR-1]PQP45103.1 MarR family transcriptional regulator [Mycolicibacterium austroafricanum]
MAPLSLDEHLCFALYSASRAMTAAYRPLLTELGITYPQYLVLLVLGEEGDISVGRLGERLQLDSGTLSPLLKRMEAGGIVRRQRSETDERQVEVALTTEGKRLRRKVHCIPEKLFPLTGLTPEQAIDLRADIVRLTEALIDSQEGNPHG